MAALRVAFMPPAAALVGSELFYADDGTLDVKVTADQIKAFATPGSPAFSVGNGGTVTQLTSKATGVTINKLCGQITTHNAALAAGAEVVFVVTNSQCAATDCVIVNHVSGGTLGSYGIYACGNAAGSFRIMIANLHTASRTEALVLNFAIIKAVVT